MQLYGPTDDDRDGKTKYAGMLLEFVNETDDPAQEQLLLTPVLIDPEAGTMEAAGLEVTVKGESETVYCAVWTADGFDYAILADPAHRRVFFRPGERHGLCFDPMREKPREGPCVFRVGSI